MPVLERLSIALNAARRHVRAFWWGQQAMGPAARWGTWLIMPWVIPSGWWTVCLGWDTFNGLMAIPTTEGLHALIDGQVLRLFGQLIAPLLLFALSAGTCMAYFYAWAQSRREKDPDGYADAVDRPEDARLGKAHAQQAATAVHAALPEPSAERQPRRRL